MVMNECDLQAKKIVVGHRYPSPNITLSNSIQTSRKNIKSVLCVEAWLHAMKDVLWTAFLYNSKSWQTRSDIT